MPEITIKKPEKVKNKYADKKGREVIKTPGTTIIKNLGRHHRNVLVGVPTLGIVRMEWSVYRRGQIIPINWQCGEITATHMPESVISMGYQVADAQNVICERFLNDKYEWLLLWEDDVIPPFDAFCKFDAHIATATAPIISGLYFTKGIPSWPLVFRGRGNGAYTNFNIGDLVWTDGVPTGMLLIHRSIIEEVSKDSERYKMPDGKMLKRIFKTPTQSWFDPEQNRYFQHMGTSDLYFCDHIIDNGILKKAGWNKVADKKYPYLVDTSIFCQHIDLNTGVIYPNQGPRVLWPKKEK